VSGEPREPETLIPSLPSSLTAAVRAEACGRFRIHCLHETHHKIPGVIGAVFVDGAANAMDPTKQRLNAEPTKRPEYSVHTPSFNKNDPQVLEFKDILPRTQNMRRDDRALLYTPAPNQSQLKFPESQAK